MTNLHDPGRSRRTRRRFLTGMTLLGFGAAASAFSGCREGRTAPSTVSGSRGPRPGGSILVAHPTLQPFATLDPLSNSYLGTFVSIENHKDAAPVSLDTNLLPAPGLAERWEVSNDGLTYAFTLVQGASFQDGSPVDAEAVKWNIERRQSGNPNSPPGRTTPTVFPNRMEVPDARTLVVTLNKPYASFLQGMSTYSLGGMISRTTHAKPLSDPYGYDTNADAKPVTPGAFKVEDFAAKESIKLSRFDGYYRGGPHLDQIQFRAVPEDGTRVTMLKTGAAQIAMNIPPQNISEIMQDQRLNLDSRPGQKILLLYVNLLKSPWGPDATSARAVKLRQAVMYGINRQAIVEKILDGEGTVADSPMVAYQFGYTHGTVYSHDPARAKQLLAEVGWDRTYKPVLSVGKGFATASDTIAQAIQANLMEIGMDVQLDVWGDYGAKVTNVGSTDPSEVSRWDLSFDAFSMLPEPAERIYGIFHSTQARFARIKSAPLDALLEKQLYSNDVEQRKQWIAEIQAYAMETLPYIPLYYQYYTIAWKKALRDVVIQNTESFDLTQSWLEA